VKIIGVANIYSMNGWRMDDFGRSGLVGHLAVMQRDIAKRSSPFSECFDKNGNFYQLNNP
jgi:hypothetical protein